MPRLPCDEFCGQVVATHGDVFGLRAGAYRDEKHAVALSIPGVDPLVVDTIDLLPHRLFRLRGTDHLHVAGLAASTNSLPKKNDLP